MSDLDDICTGLEAKAGHLRQVLDCTGEAITALRKLQLALGGEEPQPPVRAALKPVSALKGLTHVSPEFLPTKPAKAKDVDRHGHQVHGSARPRTATCRNEPCGKEFPVKGPGRVPHYCSDVCRTASGKRQRRKAADPTDELLHRQDPIPESGAGMKARVATRKGPTFLDRARERNDEAARRNGVGR